MTAHRPEKQWRLQVTLAPENKNYRIQHQSDNARGNCADLRDRRPNDENQPEQNGADRHHLLADTFDRAFHHDGV